MSIIKVDYGSLDGGGYKTKSDTITTSISPFTYTFDDMKNVYVAYSNYSNRTAFTYIDENGNEHQATEGGMTISISGNVITVNTPYSGTSLTFNIYGIGN